MMKDADFIHNIVKAIGPASPLAVKSVHHSPRRDPNGPKRPQAPWLGKGYVPFGYSGSPPSRRGGITSSPTGIARWTCHIKSSESIDWSWCSFENHDFQFKGKCKGNDLLQIIFFRTFCPTSSLNKSERLRFPNLIHTHDSSIGLSPRERSSP